MKEYIDRGHKVLLTVGIVAKPDSPLKPDTHVASVKVANPGKLSEYKLHLVSVRAKLTRCASAHQVSDFTRNSMESVRPEPRVSSRWTAR